jgi:hypothetical protein
MLLWIKSLWHKIMAFRLIGGTCIIVTVMFTMSIQVWDRTQFANTELHEDVLERWGQPISQASPSIRFVKTGSVYTSLDKLPLASQSINFDAKMNYRKRGLVYFSGFDFKFNADYSVKNDQGSEIDIVFVFPVNLEKNRVLLKDFQFKVNNKPAQIDRSGESKKLVWTGRLKVDEVLSFSIQYAGRGLDKFVYTLDPSLQVKDFNMQANITGGDNFDYPSGVVPASSTSQKEDNIRLQWGYQALESGVPIGLILPSQKSYSHIIKVMIERALVTFILFLIGVNLLAIYFKQPMRTYQAYLIYASFSFFYVLLPYLTAFMHFHLAYALSLAVTALFLYLFLRRAIHALAANLAMGLLLAFLFIPTLAVVLQGYTGLIYTLEILLGLGVLMWFASSSKHQVQVDNIITDSNSSKEPQESLESVTQVGQLSTDENKEQGDRNEK